MRNLFCFASIIFILLGCSEEQQHRAKSNAIVAEGFLQQKVTELSGRNSIIDNIVFETRDDLPTDESYQVIIDETKATIKGKNYQGLLYGLLDLNELTEHESPKEVDFTPALPVRAIKFNLPWSAYRESASMGIHETTCRDPEFWRTFLDMMLENRFNTLLLYNKHPFPFLIKLDEYPEACPFSEREMLEWKDFWTTLFKMAKERAIEVFIVNWNIVVSPTFAAAHHIKEENDTSALTIDYTRKSVTALINQYPGLAGIGVTLADWMNGLSPGEKEDWISRTFIDGMQKANRPVKFLHRAVLSGSSDEMRKILDEAKLSQPSYVEVKFNWSHGHSTPKLLITHASEAGDVNTGFWDPTPTNYNIQWMIRNEDFFILPWGDPDFIRDHLYLNIKPFVNGYHIGSEGYIPAKNYFDKSPDAPQYAFERQWMFYMLWGRLLYDQNTTDRYFSDRINTLLKTNQGQKMLDAYKYSSRMPLALASFFKSTWDYTLYSEGFLAPVIRTQYGLDDHESPFISLAEIMNHQTLDTALLSIAEADQMILNHQGKKDWQKTPNELADQLLQNANVALQIINELEISDQNALMTQSLNGLTIWCYLSQYFGFKLKAGMILSGYLHNRNPNHKSQALDYLNRALEAWEKLSELADTQYYEVPYWESRVFHGDSSLNSFSWSKYLPQVKKDIDWAKGL